MRSSARSAGLLGTLLSGWTIFASVSRLAPRPRAPIENRAGAYIHEVAEFKKQVGVVFVNDRIFHERRVVRAGRRFDLFESRRLRHPWRPRSHPRSHQRRQRSRPSSNSYVFEMTVSKETFSSARSSKSS